MVKGFKSYKLLYSLVDSVELVELNSSFYINKIDPFFSKLDDDKLYTGILCATFISKYGTMQSVVVSNEAFKFSKKSDKDGLSRLLFLQTNIVFEKYDVDQIKNLFVKYREWVLPSVFDKSIDFINNVLNKIIEVKNNIRGEFKELLIDFSFLNNVEYAPLLDINSFDKVYPNYTIKTKYINKILYSEVFYNNIFLYRWTDTLFSNGVVIRTIPFFVKLVFKDGILIQKNLLNKAPRYPDRSIIPIENIKFGVFDFETTSINDSGEQNIIAAMVYVGDILYSYWIQDYKSQDDLLLDLFTKLLQDYSGYTFYAHNGSNFDFQFCLSSLYKLGISDLIIRDDTNEIISLNIKHNKNIIYLRDSYLLVPVSLNQMAKELKLENKLYFPHSFVNINNLNYIGCTPDITYYKNIAVESYNKLIKKDWNLKNELLKYLTRDVELLYNSLLITHTEFYSLFNINITDSKTLSSLSHKLYFGLFYKKRYDIRNLSGKMEDFIRRSYKGGAVNCFDNKIFSCFILDFNSSYSASMYFNPMPVGPGFFSDETNLNIIYGFAEAEVTTYLSKRAIVGVTNELGEFTFPTGTFKGVFYSEELKELLKYDTKANIKILNAVLFKKEFSLFKKYIDYLYKMKSNSTGVRRLIAKLLLNSLYGKFGMKKLILESKICTKNEIEILDKNKNIKFIIPINDDAFIATYSNEHYPDLFKEHKDIIELSRQYISHSNTAIASATTATSRIKLNELLHLPGLNVYYFDTDSIICDKLPPEEYIGSELGKLKLEHIIESGIIVGKKLYYLECIDPKTGAKYTVKKAKGIGGSEMNKDDYEKLIKGESIIKNKTKFYKDFKSVHIVDSTITIKGNK